VCSRAWFGFFILIDVTRGQHVRLIGQFDSASRGYLEAVANDIADTTREIVGAHPPLDLPIFCYHRSDIPITQLNDWRNPTAILIGVTVNDRYYSQLAYQLGHEMAHVMVHPGETNQTVETLATALSLETLDHMADRWQRKPPPAVPKARDYAFNFTRYRAEREQEALALLPKHVQKAAAERDWTSLRAYLKQENARLRNNEQKELTTTHARALQTVGAIVLRSGQIRWNRMTSIHECANRSIVQNPEFIVSQFDRACALTLMPELRRSGLP